MSQRASRVLQQGTESRRSTTFSGVTIVRSIPPERIQHMWRRLYLLAEAFLRFTQRKNFLMTVMGEDTINPPEEEEEYEKIYVDPDRPSQKTNKPWRIITFQGEKYVVGKEMPEGKGVVDKKKHTHDPLTCQHPSDMMSGRGGRGDKKWWCCQACGTRWERILLSSFEGTKDRQSGTDLITFGKHAGKTYNTVYVQHPDYCDWILRTAETGDSPCQSLLKFAKYLATREARSPDDIPAGRMDDEL